MAAKKDANIYNFVYDTRENVQSYFDSLKFKFFETGKILSFCIYHLCDSGFYVFQLNELKGFSHKKLFFDICSP